MKRIRQLILVSSVIFSPDVLCDITSLIDGVGINDINIYQIAPTSIEYARARRSHLNNNDQGVAAFLHVPNTTDLYSLSRNLNVYHTNFDTKQLVGHWPLSRWTHQYASPDIASHWKEVNLDYPKSMHYERVMPGPGCLGNIPLRYGDIDNDSQSELVIYLGGLLTVFSPQYQRTVFAEYIEESDWLNEEEMLNEFGPAGLSNAQYGSSLWLESNYAQGPGLRTYAKLYIGDYDNDTQPDILVWRKGYRSNAKTDPIKGFTLIRNEYQHFERDLTAQAQLPAGVTGEYLPQTTDAATIQTWLSEKNQTWLTGYPSQSECAGQAGQLIPEMHDPLLNDPDVLPPAPVSTP